MNNIFSQRLSELRHKNGWSQKETAARLGISQALLSHYEKGIRECGLDFLIKASQIFNCSTDYLLGITSNANEPVEFNADKIDSDLKDAPELINGRATAINSLSLLYSITARIGKSEINKDFNKFILSEIYYVLRLFQGHYFDENNFNKNFSLSLIDTKAVSTNAFSSIINNLNKQNIKLDLKKEQIEDEYPTCSKSFYNIINKNEK